MMSEEGRLRQLEKEVATLTTELRAHMTYCNARMAVIWKLAGGLSAMVALAISAGVAYMTRS